ncbi:MAG TPA: AAA family ATPase [Candidatus Acidoferrum sp.]|nr:AAA family ATPase [Candidatus Acidoferrum sp.]
MYISPYIGRTGIVDAIIRTQVIPRLPDPALDPLERKLLFSGPPGLAKTELAMQLALAITGHPLNVEFKMGTQISVEVVRDWLRSAPYRPLWGQFTVKVIDEVNTIPPTAVTELRQFLDFLQPWTVVIATTNLEPCKLAEPLQTRFTIYKFDRVPARLVAAHLIEKFPEVPPDQLAQIANKTAGDVRAAKADAAQQRNVLRFVELQQQEAA